MRAPLDAPLAAAILLSVGACLAMLPTTLLALALVAAAPVAIAAARWRSLADAEPGIGLAIALLALGTVARLLPAPAVWPAAALGALGAWRAYRLAGSPAARELVAVVVGCHVSLQLLALAGARPPEAMGVGLAVALALSLAAEPRTPPATSTDAPTGRSRPA